MRSMEATETEGDRRPEDETNQVALGEQKQVIDEEGEITKTGGIIKFPFSDHKGEV